ncbi:MAG: transcriptional coactivator p15/PC4 family protein [Candidatus Latescibacterota bacterium]|nr:MAG: transcriptional coactivator p15/PC4 family protein [Candidatus Latescibacterota bacterium]
MEHVISRIAKNQKNELRVTLSDFTGAPRLDIRQWFLRPDGNFTPTGKGVSLATEEISEFLHILRNIYRKSTLGDKATMLRDGTSYIEVSYSEYRGHTYIEARAWPSNKGFTIRPSLTPRLIKAIEDASDSDIVTQSSRETEPTEYAPQEHHTNGFSHNNSSGPSAWSNLLVVVAVGSFALMFVMHGFVFVFLIAAFLLKFATRD